MRDDATLEHARKQMLGCNSYVLFSDFSDPARNIVKLYDDMVLGEPCVTKYGKWANVTEKFRAAWMYLAETTAAAPFDWYVKLDSDTFVRPRKLVAWLLRFDPKDALVVADDSPRNRNQQNKSNHFKLEGAIEAVTGAAVHSPKRFYDVTVEDIGDPIAWCEDEWLNNAITKTGGQVLKARNPYSDDSALVSMGVNSSCIGYLLTHREGVYPPNSDELVYGVDGKEGTMNRTVRRDIFLQDYVGALGNCLSKDIAAIHPVKDAETYAQLQQLDVAATLREE
jgi:hypothetical protein